MADDYKNKPVAFIARKEWSGETAYIVAGGPSVKHQNIELLKGCRVIAINSSYLTVPWANILWFSDARWYNHHRLTHMKELMSFKGRQITNAPAIRGPNLLSMVRSSPPPYIDLRPTHVVNQRTSLHGALNLCWHFDVKRIVLLGADMSRDKAGISHHHEPHPWKNEDGNKCWDKQMEHLKMTAPLLAEKGIEVINTSLVSRIDWWPKEPLETAIERN